MKTIQKTYDNGLRVIFEKNNKNVVAVNILFFVGSQNETENEEGYSHFIEHLVFKGTPKRSAEKLSKELTFYGADFNAYTSRRLTRFIFKSLKENFEKCFEIYADMLVNASFRQGDVDKERNVVIEEMKRCADDPVEVMYARVLKNYYYGNSYAHDELGKEEIIANVTPNELLEYKNRFYIPQNCVISVVGNLDFNDVDNIIKQNFAKWFAVKAEPTKVSFERFKIKINNKFDIVERDDNQVNVCIHIKSILVNSKLKQVADLYTCILGGSSSSKLYTRIREQLGFVYTIDAFSSFSAQTGELCIYFGTRAQNVKKALAEIKSILVNFAELVTDEELEAAKNFKKSTMEYSKEKSATVAEMNGSDIHLFGKLISSKTIAAKYNKVTLDDIKEFANKIAAEKTFNVVAVGKGVKEEDIKF
ncbi:MAG: insulinase family protein [Clostridia bacterium]|nr:insulinase family protein [Clostridia bacterium]